MTVSSSRVVGGGVAGLQWAIDGDNLIFAALDTGERIATVSGPVKKHETKEYGNHDPGGDVHAVEWGAHP